MDTEDRSSAPDTEEKAVREKQLWALEAYARASRALIHAKTPQALIELVCRAVTEMPPYLIAWVGMALNDPQKTVKVLSIAGAVTAKNYVNGLRVSWDASVPEGQGPAGLAIRSGKTQILTDTETDQNFLPWLERARTFAIRSVVSVPMFSNDKVIGVMLVYASQPSAFGKYEIRLFENLAAEIAHGLNKFGNCELP